MKVICFGDSNTYGYDPRSWIGGRYAREDRWVDILADMTGWDVSNMGENGRAIPTKAAAFAEDADMIIVMLGTNDLLMGMEPEAVSEKMERFLSALDAGGAGDAGMEKIVLIAPPPVTAGEWVQDADTIGYSIRLAELYGKAAERCGVRFADAGKWNVSMTYDGVHFTEEGHRAFAEGLYRYLTDDAKEGAMIKVLDHQRKDVAYLFDGIWDSMVIAYLQGYQGKAWVNRMPEPDIGLIASGEYLFIGGDADHDEAGKLAADISGYINGDAATVIYSQSSMAWRDLLLSANPGNAHEIKRHWIVQRDYDFDIGRLQQFAGNIPEGYEMRAFDRELYDQSMSEAWSEEFCNAFSSPEEFLEEGFGYGLMRDGRIVAGTASMSVYDGGVEIQVATKEEFRRKGLALPTAARFILECIDRGIRPCWDAANSISLHMAMKLGYEYNGEYSAVHISKEENS